MPVINRIAAIAEEATQWRRDLHENPETDYDVVRTAALVAEKLKAFGVDEIVTGIGRTGVVGVIRGSRPGGGRAIGLRADMDALPILEATGVPYASKVPGKMHACGHDGHTTMLLGAAKYLAETRNFSGKAVVIFQPAEEGGAGGRAMVEDGLMTRFGVDEVYAMHNKPGMPVGQFGVGVGPQMAAGDKFTVTITGKGGHAAYPHTTIDPVVAASHMVAAVQTIASRNVNPLDSIVVSVTSVEAGNTYNVIPEEAKLRGTVRTLTKATRELAQARFRTILEQFAKAFDCKVEIDYALGYPVTANPEAQARFAVEVAREIAGEPNVTTNEPPQMGAEDFSFMLAERPGAYVWIGNGDSAALHNPRYDFDDGAIAYGASFFARVVEKAAA